MNTHKYISLILLTLLAMVGCQKEDNPELATAENRVAPELVSPVGDLQYVLSREIDDSPFETFIYTEADFGHQLVVNYAVQVTTSDDTNFESAINMQEAQNGLYQTITNKDFNLVLYSLGLPVGVASEVLIRVHASHDNAEVGELISNVVTLNVTPYDASFDPIYIIGPSTEAEWDAGAAIPIAGTSLTTYEGEVNLIAKDADGNDTMFRFLFQQAWGDDLQYDEFDTVESSPEGLFVRVENEYGESHFVPTQDGTFNIEINLDNGGKKTFKATLVE